jgi:hypothetical protein
VIVLAAAAGLSGCSSIRSAAGIDKSTPDEFAVVTKAPLVIPPDYNLHPPKPGAVPTNQQSPTASAQAALYASDESGANPTPQSGGNFSDGEKAILAQANATNADHSIRQEIASDEKSMQGADESFTDKVLFGGGPTDNSDKAVNADANSTANMPGKAPAPAADGAAQPAPAPKPVITQNQKKDNDGWFGWLGL